MVGLGGACKHVAALLLKLEAVVHLNLNEPDASTSLLSSWKATRKHVGPALIISNDINQEIYGISGEPTVAAASKYIYIYTNPMAGPYGLTAGQLQSSQHT